MKKRILSTLLALCMVLALLPGTANATGDITEAEVRERLKSAELIWKNGTRYVESYASGGCKQCFGFGRELFQYVFYAQLPASWSISKAKFNGNLQNVQEVGHLNSGYSLYALKSLLSRAKIGDVLVASNGTYNHLVIIRAVQSDGSGIYVYDANWDHHNGIRTNAYWGATAIQSGRSRGVTLYRYKNYSGNSTPAVTASTISGKWTVTVPANHKLLCYSSATAAYNTTYISARSSAYRISCTQKATLSNGGTRYFFVSGDNKSLWFDYTSGMSVTSQNNTTCSVYFNANGGSVSPSYKTCTIGSTYGTLPTPTRSGYTFDGWYTASSGGSEVSSGSTVTSKITLYAHWTAKPDTGITTGKWTVTVPANYKLLCYSSATATRNSTYISAKRYSYQISCTQKAVLPNGSTRYFFISGDNKSLWFEFTSNMTLKEQNSGGSTTPDLPDSTNVCRVSLNANGGSVSPGYINVSLGSACGTLPTPTRNGYKFNGWYTSYSGGRRVVSSTIVTSDVTLYAHWTAVPTGFYITVPANYKLPLYSSSSVTASPVTYVRAQSSSYRIYCTSKTSLSNGTTWYYAAFNNGQDHYWFAVPTTVRGEWMVTVPASYRLPLYSSDIAGSSSAYVRAQSRSYQIYCTKWTTLPDGTNRFYALFDNGRNAYWFDLVRNMSMYKIF